MYILNIKRPCVSAKVIRRTFLRCEVARVDDLLRGLREERDAEARLVHLLHHLQQVGVREARPGRPHGDSLTTSTRATGGCAKGWGGRGMDGV